MRHTYRLQVWMPMRNNWFDFTGGECTREFGMGYIASHREGPTPRCGIRLLRSDGKEVDKVSEVNEVGIGMIAGWPTWGQYTHAAQRALATASKIAGANKKPLVAAELARLSMLCEELLREDSDG